MRLSHDINEAALLIVRIATPFDYLFARTFEPRPNQGKLIEHKELQPQQGSAGWTPVRRVGQVSLV